MNQEILEDLYRAKDCLYKLADKIHATEDRLTFVTAVGSISNAIAKLELKK